MAFRINHIHLKSPDPGKMVEWWVSAFKFKVVSDEVRPSGDRFIRCLSEDGGLGVNVSGARTGEKPGPGDANIHYGLEHFGLDTADVDADVARLQKLGAVLQEGPMTMPTGVRIAFMSAPGDVRFELIQPAKK